MKSIKIKVHSFIDIITNSSTEIYVSATKNTIKSVYELLDRFLLEKGSVYTNAADVFSVTTSYNYHNIDNYYIEYEDYTIEEAQEYCKDNGEYSTDIIITVNKGYEEYQPIVDCINKMISTFEGTEVGNG